MRNPHEARAASPSLRVHDAMQAAQAGLARTGSLDAEQDLLPILRDPKTTEIEQTEEVREQIDGARDAAGVDDAAEVALVNASTAVRVAEIGVEEAGARDRSRRR